MSCSSISFSFFFFNDTATTEIYTLSLHDALPISQRQRNRFDDVELQVAKPTHRLEDRFERGDASQGCGCLGARESAKSPQHGEGRTLWEWCIISRCCFGSRRTH